MIWINAQRLSLLEDWPWQWQVVGICIGWWCNGGFGSGEAVVLGFMDSSTTVCCCVGLGITFGPGLGCFLFFFVFCCLVVTINPYLSFVGLGWLSTCLHTLCALIVLSSVQVIIKWSLCSSDRIKQSVIGGISVWQHIG